MRILFWLLALPILLLAVVFAVANRHELRLELWPLPWVLDLPVYLAVLGALAKGLLIGAVITWLAGHRVRVAATRERRRAESLERQLDAARAEIEQVKARMATPALPPVITEG